MKHKDKWYQRRLAKYFEEHYLEYEDDAEWFNDPDINTWLFDIRDLGYRIELLCRDNGTIEETKYPLKGMYWEKC